MVFDLLLCSKMPWDVVNSDFGGEETVNFGPREESGSALYQIDTLATITSQEKVWALALGYKYNRSPTFYIVYNSDFIPIIGDRNSPHCELGGWRISVPISRLSCLRVHGLPTHNHTGLW